MARINLLPWRQEERERKNKEFQTLLIGTALIAAILAFIGYSVLNNVLESQQAANKRIEDANAQLDVALKSIEDLEAQREQMLSQMKVIQDLQGRRSIPVRVWDDMARAVPSAMYLVNVKREADLITLTGQAANANVVAALVRNLNTSQWLDGSAVISIKSKVQAYQEPAAAQPQATDGKTPARPIYPEDDYVEFVVTTKVQEPQANPDGTTGEAVPMPEATVADPATFDPSLAQPIGAEPVGTPAPDAAATPPAGQAAPAPAPAPTAAVPATPPPAPTPTAQATPTPPPPAGQANPAPSNAPVGGQ